MKILNILFFIVFIGMVQIIYVVANQRSSEVNKTISSEEAVKLAQNFLAKQPWANSFLSDNSKVLEKETVWEVYFKNIKWQDIHPSHCLIQVDKVTGKIKHIPLR